MRVISIFLTFCCLILSSCDNVENTEYSLLYDEVMAIHDEVMPKMRDISKAKKSLKKINDESLNEMVQQQITQLEDADEAMMSWMHDFKKPKMEKMEDNLAYLKKEKVAITVVKEQMLTSILEAQEFIKLNTKQ